MAKKPTTDDDRPTLKAVLAKAKQLREQATKAREADPNVDLYSPSDDAARKLCSILSIQHGKDNGPELAIRELLRRARERELTLEEHGARSSASRRRHLVHQAGAAGERDAERDRMTLGERLDEALRGLGVVSETPAVRLDGDRVSGSSAGRGDHLARLVDTPRHRRMLERDRIAEDAERLVRRAERELDSARRRVVEQEAA